MALFKIDSLFCSPEKDAPGALIAFVKSHLTFECNVSLTGTLHRAPDSRNEYENKEMK